MFGPENGESNSLALEKIYGMLILQIRMRFGHLNYRDIKQLSHKGGVTGTPGPHPSYTPEEEKDNLAVASLGPP